MSGVDVLQQMEVATKRLRLGVYGPLTADALDEARAAVAELIEALEIARKQMAHRGCGRVRPTSEWKEHGSMSFDNCNCDIRRVDAALSRVRGAA